MTTVRMNRINDLGGSIGRIGHDRRSGPPGTAGQRRFFVFNYIRALRIVRGTDLPSHYPPKWTHNGPIKDPGSLGGAA